MKFSTRTTYGLRAMIRLAESYDQGSLSLQKIAQEEKLPHKYLERLFAQLKKSGLVKSEKGVMGGYVLIKNPDKINVYEIIKALEGTISPFHCINDKGEVHCSKKCGCEVVSVLAKVQTSINKTLINIKLSSLI